MMKAGRNLLFLVAHTIVVVALTSAITVGTSFQSFAAKEKFVRDKVHVNIGTIASSGVDLTLTSADGQRTTTTSDTGEFWFEGLKPGRMKLFVGNLSFGDHPPEPGRIAIEGAYVATVGGSAGPKSSKPKEIVVVGSKLPSPNQPERSFQQLDSETQSRIPAHTPEWTDHNESDPGSGILDYEIQHHEDGTATITFGDGIRGARLPTGKDDDDDDKDVPPIITDPGQGIPQPGTSAAADDKHKQWIDILAFHQNSKLNSVSAIIPASARGDSFFDIFVEVGVSSLKGSIVLVGDDGEQEKPEKPDIPDRPERIDLPDLPTRPNR